MAEPLVSVVIPVHNAERYVAETLDSVFAQTYPDIEVVVVDDGSSDDSELALAPYRDRIVYINQANAGVSAARNAGIRRATGEYVAFLDADDLWEPDKLAIQVARLGETGAALVHSNASYMDESGNPRPPHIPDFPYACEGMCFNRLFLDGNGLMTSSVMVRRQCLEEAGLFTVGVAYAEDYELWLKIAFRWPLAWCPQALVRYRLHERAATAQAKPEHKATELRMLLRLLRETAESFSGQERKALKQRLFHLHHTLARQYAKSGSLSSVIHVLHALRLKPGLLLWQTLGPGTRGRLLWYRTRLRQILGHP